MYFSNEYIQIRGQLIEENFSFIDMYNSVSEKVQIAIIESVLHNYKIEHKSDLGIKELIGLIPKDLMDDLANTLKSMYRKIENTDYSNKHLAYTMYYLPNNINKIWKPLIDLMQNQLLKYKIDVLDIGCGPGTIAVGLISFYEKLANIFTDEKFQVNINVVDAESNFIQYADSILNRYIKEKPTNLEINITSLVKQVNNNIRFNKEYDLITMSNFINVNETKETHLDREYFITSLRRNLKKDGSIVVIESATEKSNKYLKNIRNNLINNDVYNLYSPCSNIWTRENKFNCNCSSSYQLPIKTWEILEYLRITNTVTNYKDYVSFIYLVLRKDNIRKYRCEKNKNTYNFLSEINSIGSLYSIKGIVRAKSFNNLKVYLCDGTINSSKRVVAIKIKDIDILKRMNLGELVSIRKIVCKEINAREILLELQTDSVIKISY